MFSTEEAPVFGVSAVKALALAGAAGQKIWTVEQDNVGIALAAINHSSEIESEIRNAVRVGKVATIHEAPVAYQGSTFVGYTIIDPVTGAGAYKIGGGENGGELLLGFINGFGLAGLLAGFAFGAAPALLLVLGVVLVASIIATNIALATSGGNVGCYLQGVSSGVGVFAILGAILSYYGVLGGIGSANSLKSLLYSLLAPFALDRVLPITPIQDCF